MPFCLTPTWDDEKVTYEDIMHRTSDKTKREGWTKIEESCRLAVEDGLEYCWVDTRRIDKTSSAILTEEINSTFKWYVYLWERGWTLQELIAPGVIELYDKTSAYFDEEVLTLREYPVSYILSQQPVCRKMFLAAKRKTMREEDLAYSLLGIFGVHALKRLQEETTKNSNDYIVLA
ncbi:HET-domain-containing protein [Hypomontagnella submonticulosa]|nr:HET-domain-containing protein [Hypomontagnella submonticulosa]